MVVTAPAGALAIVNRPSTPDIVPIVAPSMRTLTSEIPWPVTASTTRPTMRPGALATPVCAPRGATATRTSRAVRYRVVTALSIRISPEPMRGRVGARRAQRPAKAPTVSRRFGHDAATDASRPVTNRERGERTAGGPTGKGKGGKEDRGKRGQEGHKKGPQNECGG